MEELEKKLVGLLEKAINAAEKTGEFAIEQAPELVKEFYNWEIASLIMMIITPVIALLLIKPIAKRLFLTKNDIDNDTFKLDEVNQGITVVQIFVLAVGSIFIVRGIYLLVYILTAPKLYLLEHVLNYIK
jgi:hypothetical protein